MSSEVQINLSKWFKWWPKIDIPGVYLLGLFDEVPADCNPIDERIIYIGETHNSTLNKRLKKFNWSVTTGKRAHCGGRTLRDEKACMDINKLHIAYFTPDPNKTKEVKTAIIKYVERKLILDYALYWGKIPQCNKE